MADRMTLTVADRRLFAQRGRPGDLGLPFAENAAVAVDMLRNAQSRVQMDYDVAEGREVKRLLRRGRIIS